MTKSIHPFFKKLIKNYDYPKLRDNFKLEILFDRMMYRKKGQKAVAEAWHRDVIMKGKINKRDEIFGGWINLDSHDQYFSFIPGSHLGILASEIHSGFDTMVNNLTRQFLDDKSVKLATQDMKQNDRKKYIDKLIKNTMNKINKYKYRAVVPPGHIILFPQYILHEVVATPAKHDMMRLFNGIRLTTGEKTLNSVDMMNDQKIPLLPGGMYPPIYSANHGSCFLGIPILKKIKDTDYKVKKTWVNDIVSKLIFLVPNPTFGHTIKSKLSKTNTLKDKKLLISLLYEDYLKQFNINIKWDKKTFINNSNAILTLKGIFKTNPNQENTKTTLIKWSQAR